MARVSPGDELPRPRSRAKAVDVAALAQVSVATVSLVANGKADGRVSPTTQQRVADAIAQLGYVVNPAARSLATGRRRCVALVARDMTNPFISAIAAGVSEALGNEVQLLLAVSGSGSQTPDLEQIVGFGVDGVLLDYPMSLPADEVDPPLPVVLLDDPTTGRGTSSVHFDLRHGAQQLASHLAQLSHRVVAYLDSPRPGATFGDRRRFFADQLRREVKTAKVIRLPCDIEVNAARLAVAKAWPQWQRAGVTAVVTASDVQAYGALGALAELDVAVPRTVSVASFDNLPFSAITSPPLTSINLSAFDLGFEAATLLRDVIDRGNRAHRRIQLPTELVVRGSTGPARRHRAR